MTALILGGDHPEEGATVTTSAVTASAARAGHLAALSPPRTAASSRAVTAWAWALAAVFFALYAMLSVRDQQLQRTSGFDLGIFDEAVRAYAHGRAPIVPLKGPDFNLLGDHFSPIWATLAPVYRIFPTVYTLLLAQAALLALAVVPLVRWAGREVGIGAGIVVGVGYGLSWGIASAVGFDVHEVAFAVPMLSTAPVALAHRRWRAAVAWALPLLLVKEDLGLTVAAVGLYIAFHGARRIGLATAAIGTLGTWLEMDVLIPAANHGRYEYTGSLAGTLLDPGHAGTRARRARPRHPGDQADHGCAAAGPDRLPRRALAAAPAGRTDAGVAVPVHQPGLLGHRVPVQRGAHAHRVRGFHRHPVRLKANRGPPRRHDHPGRPHRQPQRQRATATELPLANLARPSWWRNDPRIAAADRVMDLIPNGASVAASNWLAPQLTDRDTVTLFQKSTATERPLPDWVLVDVETAEVFPDPPAVQQATIARLRTEGYQTAADQDGYLLLHLRA
jgi:hypothetical protein